jgi:cytidylate kinase
MGSYIKEFQGDHEKNSEVVVTVDGPSGAGKGTIADHISKRLRIAHFSASDVFYQIAEDRGISHVELAQKAGKEVDLEVDRRTLERGLENNCVIDSRIASWVLGDYSDFRIFVTADLEERATRIAGREKIPLQKAKEDTEERDRENSRRYEDYYGIDTEEREIYDLIIDNTDLSIGKQEELVDKALKKQFPERYEE